MNQADKDTGDRDKGKGKDEEDEEDEELDDEESELLPKRFTWVPTTEPSVPETRHAKRADSTSMTSTTDSSASSATRAPKSICRFIAMYETAREGNIRKASSTFTLAEKDEVVGGGGKNCEISEKSKISETSPLSMTPSQNASISVEGEIKTPAGEADKRNEEVMLEDYFRDQVGDEKEGGGGDEDTSVMAISSPPRQRRRVREDVRNGDIREIHTNFFSGSSQDSIISGNCPFLKTFFAIAVVCRGLILYHPWQILAPQVSLYVMCVGGSFLAVLETQSVSLLPAKNILTARGKTERSAENPSTCDYLVSSSSR